MSTNNIDPQTISKVANLARLYKEADQDFLETSAKQLNPVLELSSEMRQDWIMEAIEEQKITPISSFRTITISELRDDTPAEDLVEYQKTAENIRTLFSKRQGNYLVISRVID